MAKKKQLPEEVAHSEAYVKDFFDMAVPSAIRFNVDHFICGDSYRSVWAIREYPPQTSDQALLARFGDKEAVTRSPVHPIGRRCGATKDSAKRKPQK